MIMLGFFCITILPLANFRDASILQPTQTTTQKKEIESLLESLHNDSLRRTSPQEIVKAIKRLGEIRAAKSVNDLISFLTFKQIFDWEDKTGEAVNEIQPIHTGNRYPATSALGNIGKPALSALLNVVQTQASQTLISENAIFAISVIYRNNPLDGIDYLTQAANKASSKQVKQRLTNAIARLQNPVAKQNRKH